MQPCYTWFSSNKHTNQHQCKMIADIKKQVRGPALYQYHPLFRLWKTIIDQPYYSTPIMSNLVNKVSLSKLSFINQLRKENWQILLSNTKSVMAVPPGYCRPIRLYLMSPGGTVFSSNAHRRPTATPTWAVARTYTLPHPLPKSRTRGLD